MLNIADAAEILVRNAVTGKFEVDLNRCPPICPNLPYAELYVTIQNVDGVEPTIMRMQSGPNGDLWISKDGPNHSSNLFEHCFTFYPQHVHACLMLLVKDYLSLQERLESSQHVLKRSRKISAGRRLFGSWKLL